MDQIRDKYFPVLDQGFCGVVDYMGDSHRIAQAARCSYGEGTKKISSDIGLIRSLMRDRHTSPFEMCELVLHVGMPIFVARQWVRHRTASLNEYSGRYSVMPMMFYTPTQDRHLTQNKSNKQGSSSDTLSNSQYEKLCVERCEVRAKIEEHYDKCLNYDLARELSRIDLPLSTYTYWYWKIDLHNLLHFLKLRLDKHAQWEIQQYARVIAGIVKKWVPEVWEAFDDYILNGITFSRQEQGVILQFANIFNTTYLYDNMSDIINKCNELHMSIRETNDFLQKVQSMGGGQFFDDVELDMSTAQTADYFEKKIEACA